MICWRNPNEGGVSAKLDGLSGDRACAGGLGHAPTFWGCFDLCYGTWGRRWLFQKRSDSDFTVYLTGRLFPFSFTLRTYSGGSEVSWAVAWGASPMVTVD